MSAQAPPESGQPKRAPAVSRLARLTFAATAMGIVVSALAIGARVAINPALGLYKPPPIVLIAAFPQWQEWALLAVPAIALVTASVLVVRKPGAFGLAAAACLAAVALTSSALIVAAALQWALCSFSCYTDGPELFVQAPGSVGALLGWALLAGLVAIVLCFAAGIWSLIAASRRSPGIAAAAAAVSLIIPLGTCGAWNVSDRSASPVSTYRALAPPPTNCPASNVSQLSSGQWAGAYGASPVWVSGLSRAATPAPYLRADGLDSRGWSAYHVWLLEPQLTQPVEISGSDDATGSPLWFRHPSYTLQYLPTLSLDPAAPDFPAGTGLGHAGAYNMFQVGLVVDHAACYTIVASWPGGTMKLDVAIGGY